MEFSSITEVSSTVYCLTVAVENLSIAILFKILPIFLSLDSL